ADHPTAVSDQGCEQTAGAAAQLENRPFSDFRRERPVEIDVDAPAPVLEIVERRIFVVLARAGFEGEGGWGIPLTGGTHAPRTLYSRPVTRKAVVLLSGGLDSATTLAIARAEGFACHALSFHY